MTFPSDPDPYTELRRRMVRQQIAGRGISDARLLAAFERVPRHLFVAPSFWPQAYADHPLPIGENQTISQPYIVALMTHLLRLTGSECVLEVGTGSGYQAAILGELTCQVHTVEFRPDLAAQAESVLRKLGYANVQVHVGDGSLGWPSAAPFDAILVAAAAPHTPPPLLAQLADDGRMVIPLGGQGLQHLAVWERHGDKFECTPSIPVLFVPLVGVHGVK